MSLPQEQPLIPSSNTNTTKTPLRITCYGSSSPSTPQPYLTQAYNLGKHLAIRGHTCVNGAGAHGCMGSMNEGCNDFNGHVVGVIHEMFVVDGSDWFTLNSEGSGGAHDVFCGDGKREIKIARGEGLQQRKAMLVEGADGLMVLPGGPGTLDELLEMACAKNLGLISIPIVCINVNGYYNDLKSMLFKCFDQNLMKTKIEDLIRFEPDAESAVKWIEKECATNGQGKKQQRKVIERRSASDGGSARFTRQGSLLGDAFGYMFGNGSSSSSSSSIRRKSSTLSKDEESEEENTNNSSSSSLRLADHYTSIMTFTMGVMVGMTLVTMQISKSPSR